MPRELFLSRLAGETWAALREEGRLVELHVETDLPDVCHGRIALGRVTDVVPGIQAAFVDIGGERGAFLRAADLVLPGEDPVDPPPIEDRLKPGRELLVQIRREPMGDKGPRVSCDIHVPGRLLVLMPRTPARKISRHIVEPAARERLTSILESIPGEDMGYIARSAAGDAPERSIRDEACTLVSAWKSTEAQIEDHSAPYVIPAQEDHLDRLLRDLPLQHVQRVVVDYEEGHRRLLDHAATLPGLGQRVRRHTGDVPLFGEAGLDREIARMLRPRVWLKSGGHLVIEQTEALVSIDVNTGRFTSGGRNNVLRTNLEAADEVARQLRLRDLGGMVVVDFIDMPEPEERRQVTDRLSEALTRDRVRTRVYGLSDLGLLHLTRERVRRGAFHVLTRACESCGGTARSFHPRFVVANLLLELRRSEAARRTLAVRVHPEVLERLESARPEEPALSGVRLESVSRWPVERYEIERIG